MSQNFRAVAYWGEREETIEQCVERLSLFMAHLQDISPNLSQWYQKGWTKRQAMQNQISLEPNELRTLLEAGRNRDETPQRRVIPELGYHIDIWSGERSDRNDASLDILCAAYGPYSPINHVIIELPLEWFRVESAVELVRALVTCWTPSMAAFCSQDALLEAFRSAPDDVAMPVIDWVFFHRLQRTGALRPPSRVAFELDGGECVVVQDRPVQPDRVDDRARVRELAKQLGLPESAPGA